MTLPAEPSVPMSHEEALRAIIGVASTVSLLSYQEAIEGYLKLRGIRPDAPRTPAMTSRIDLEALAVRFNGALAETDWELTAFVRENAETILASLSAETVTDQRIEQLRLALETALRKRRFVGRVEPKEAGATVEIGAGVAQNGLMALAALRARSAS